MVKRNENTASVEIEITAKDNAIDVINKSTEALDKLSESTTTNTEELDKLTESNTKFTESMNIGKAVLANSIKLVVALGIAVTITGTKLIDLLGTLAQVTQTVYMMGQEAYPYVEGVVAQFLVQLEDVTKELVDFTVLLSDVGSFLPTLFEGMFDKTAGNLEGVFNFLQKIPEGLNVIESSIRRFDKFVQESFQSTSLFFTKTAKLLGENGLELIDVADMTMAYTDIQNLFAMINENIAIVMDQITFFEQTFQALTSITQTGAFQLLINQSVELQAELLATRSSLVGTSKILNFGAEIKDPTEAIKALEDPISRVIDKMRVESLDLVGVTSKELIPVFRLVSQNITSIGASLDDAKDLTLDFAASLGTLGVPLDQAEQEIDSILTGQIDTNSVLAQNLNLTNEQVNKWKGEGKLVENLRKRLEAFRAGNALAAKSFGGVASNIQEVIDLIGQKTGEGLLEPIIEQLTRVYDYLQANMKGIMAYSEEVSKALQKAFSGIVIIVEQFSKAGGEFASKVPIYMIESLAHVINEFAKGLTFTLNVLKPFISILNTLATTVGALGSGAYKVLFALFTLGKGIDIIGTIMRKVVKRMDVAGEVLDVITARSLQTGNQFSNLATIFGRGGSAALLLGKRLESIPFLLDAINDKLGPFGAFVTPLIPQAATLGIQIGGLVTMFPALGASLLGVVAVLPKLLTLLAGALGKAKLFGVDLKPIFDPLVPSINKAASGIQVFSDTQDKANLINTTFAKGLRIAGRALAKYLIKTAVIAGSFYLAFSAIDKFILKNKELLEVVSQITTGIGLVFSVLLNKWTIGFAAVSASCTLLVFAIQGQLIPAIVKLIATQLAGVFTVAAGAATFFAGALGTLGLTAVAAQATALATGLTTMATAFTAAGGGMAAFAAGLSQVVAMSLALLGPILIIGAAVAGIGWLAYQQGAKDSAEASEEFRKQTNAVSDASIELANKLKAAKNKQAEADKAGIRLTDEEYANNKRLANQAKLRISLIEGEIKAREEAQKKTIGKENKANYDVQIAELNKMKELLTDLSTNVTIQPKDLPQLGTGLEQLRKKADQAWKAIERPSGDAGMFQQKAEEVIEFQNALLDMGDVVAEDVIPKLRQLAQDTRLDEGTQKKALDAILKIIQDEADEELNILSRQKAEIEALEAQSLISSSDKEKQLSALTVKELKIRRQVARDQQAELESYGNTEEAEKKGEEILKIEAEISKEFANELDRRNKKVLEAFQKRIDIIEGALAEGEASEEFYNNRSKALKLQELEEEEKQLRAKADKQGKYSESTLADLAKLQVERQKIISEGYSAELNLLDQTLQESVDLVAQAEANRQAERLRAFQDDGSDLAQIEVDATADSLATQMAEYEKAQALLAQMELQAPLSDPRLEAKRQADIRKARIDTANQAIGLIQTEQDAWQKNTDFQINNLNRATTTQLTGLQARVNAGEELAETLATIEAIGELESLQVQLENEKDITKQADLQLQIEKQKISIKDAQLAQSQAELDLNQDIDLESKIRATNAGLILQSELQVATAQQQIEDLQKQLELETDISKIAKLNIDLAQAENDLNEAEEAVILQKLELEQTEQLHKITKELNAGRILGAELNLFKIDQNIASLEQQIELEDDLLKLEDLKLKLTEALKQKSDAEDAVKLQKLELTQNEALLNIINQVNKGRVLSSALSLAEAKNNVVRLEKELALEEDILKISQLKIALAKAKEDVEDAQKDAITQETELKITERLIELTKEYNKGNLLSAELDIAQQENNISNLKQQIALEDDLLERKKLALELEQAKKDLENSSAELELQRLELTQNNDLLNIIKQVNDGKALGSALSLEDSKNNVAQLEKELALEEDIVKISQLKIELEQAKKDLENSSVELELQKLELTQNEALLNIINQVNDGKALGSALSLEEAKNNVAQLEKELALEKDILRISQLKIELAKAKEDVEDAEKDSIAQETELKVTEKLIQLTKEYNKGNLLSIELDIAQQESKIAMLEQQLQLEDDLLERKKLTLELEQAKEDLEDKQIEKRIRINDLAYKREIIALKKSLYAGLKTKEEVELAKAEATLRRIQIELEAEDDIEKKLSLQEQLVDAINDKTQAQVTLYASKINKELEEYNLFIKEANRELEIQTKYIDRIRESFGIQQQLYDAQAKVYSAATGFYIGELEALKFTTKNKREQAEIDEIIAGLRYEAALKQVEFDRISLQLKQEMLKIEQERAVLQQQMAVNQAKMDAEQAKANAQIVASNPQSTPLERKIAEQEARFAEQNVHFAEESLKLIQQQGTLQEALFQKEQEAFDYEAKARTRSAESSAIGAIRDPRLRREGLKAQAENIVSDFGFDNKKDLISSGISRSRSNLVEQGLLGGKGGTGVSGEDMIRQLRGEDDTSGATLSAKDEIYRIMGSAGNIASPTPTNVNATPISLPGMDSVIAPVLNPLTEIQNTIASLNPLIDRASKPNNVNLSPNLTFNINATNGVGNSIRSEVQPQIKNILNELMVLSR